jgi:hypothetical protein
MPVIYPVSSSTKAWRLMGASVFFFMFTLANNYGRSNTKPWRMMSATVRFGPTQRSRLHSSSFTHIGERAHAFPYHRLHLAGH